MLKQTIDRYLELRHAAGFEMKMDQCLLHNFARFATDRSETYVRRQTAIDWAAKAPTPSQRECRLGMVRRFADHARAEDPVHEIVPPKVFLSTKRRRPFPLSSRRKNWFSCWMPPLISAPKPHCGH